MVISISLKPQAHTGSPLGLPRRGKGDCEKEDGWNVAKRIDSGPNPLVSGLVDCVEIADCSTLPFSVSRPPQTPSPVSLPNLPFQNSRVLILSRSLNHFCRFNAVG